MKSIPTSLLLVSIGVSTLFSCNNGPKVIEAENSSAEITQPSGIFNLDRSTPSAIPPTNEGSFTEDLHKVVANEVIPASRYVYVKVTEAGQEFWIATRSQEITKGDTYFYRGGLLKTNFESKEHHRAFDKIYLVSNLVPEKHGGNMSQTGNTIDVQKSGETIQKELIPTHTEKEVQSKGQITIAELVAHPETYDGKSVQLSGTCVKVNPNIMNRNWIHLKDGTKDDFDLVITSSTFVPEGQKVTLQGVVQRNRDFGAGYTYDLILENAMVVE